MCNRGAIHVFIGAPIIASSLPCEMERSVSEGHTAGLKDIPFTHKIQDASLQSGGSHQIFAEQVLNGGQNEKAEHGKSGCDSHDVLEECFGRTCKQECDFVQKMDADDIGIISDLVSNPELITHALQRPVEKESEDQNEYLRDDQDPNVIESDVCGTILAETEFLTILRSSQLAVKSSDNNRTKGHPEVRTSEFMTPAVLVEDITTGSDSRDSFSCSSDLFSGTSDEMWNKKSFKSQKSEKGLLLIKDESAAQLRNNADYLGSASSKRKKACTGSSASSKPEQQSKQSISPVKYTMKSYEHGQQTPVKPLTLLKHCSDKNKEYSIMVVVLQPCHVKEIKVKSGPSIGSTFPLATMVVMDQSEVKQKLLMWRTAAFWSLALLPGEIIVLTNVSVCEDRWTEDVFLQSSFRSKLFNLGSCSLLSGESSHIVDRSAVKELLGYLQKKHYYLSEFCPRRPQILEHIQHLSLAELQPESLVHSVLKVNNISILKESTYHFNGLQQNKIILAVEQVKGQASTLVLWGTCVSWSHQIHLKKDHIWIFKYLLCKKNGISGDLELHTTPWSSCECLFDDDQRAIDFRKRYNISSAKQMSLLTMIEDRYSGEIQVKGSIIQIEFNISGKRKILINHETSISDILKSLPDIICTGCGKCRRGLNIDDNNVYEQCYMCLPFNQVRIFYRSALMTVVSHDCCVRVQVPPDILENVFLNISPNLLARVFPSCTEVTYGAIVADLCHSLLAQTGESFVFTIRSQFVLDENSIPLEADFHLLDFHLDL